MTIERTTPLNDPEAMKAYYEEKVKEFIASGYGEHPELEQYILSNIQYDGSASSQCEFLAEKYLFECLDSNDEDHDILEDEESDILEEEEADILEGESDE